MFTAYGTSNRGRGDHTYAWTIQAEEGGLKEARDLAAYVAEGQAGKALVDSLGLCDFFTGDITAEPFLSLYRALTGDRLHARIAQGLRPEDLRARAAPEQRSRAGTGPTTPSSRPSSRSP